MPRRVGTKVRYKNPVTGDIFDAVITRVIRGRPVQYVIKIEHGGYAGQLNSGIIAYSDEIWTKSKKKKKRRR